MTPFLDTGEENCNLDSSVEFQLRHKFKSREAVLQGVKNYSIRRSTEYRVIESNRCTKCLKESCIVVFREVRKVGGVHSCLAPTMSQNHRQLDSSLICWVILPLIQSNHSVSILVLQGAVQASYHFKPSYKKALQSCFPGTLCDLRVKPLYDGHLLVRDCSMFDKYGGVLLIAVAQDGNSNILPIAFSIVESESTESWSFFLTNLRHHVTPQDGLPVISDRSQAIKAALSTDDSGLSPPRAYHAYCIRHMAANFMTRFKSAEGKRYLINAAYSPSKASYEWYMDALRGVSPTMVDWAMLKGTRYLPISAIVRITYERLQKLFVMKGKEAQSLLAAGR
nr:uncharacterized protein LOC114924537 [Arachis hypogaea]